jgi:hypothetical protein
VARLCLVRASNIGVEGRLSLTALPPTKTAPPNQRGDTYKRDSTARALLWYSTHIIHDLRRDRKVTTVGKDEDRDIRIADDRVSGHHCRLESRARGTVLIDEHSRNGTHHETRRTFGLGLKPSFETTPVPADGVHLRPGMTFVVGDIGHRYIAIDGAMRKHHPARLDILGTEDEVRGTPELVSPSDFLLAADSGGHILITGNPGCGHDELADVVHKISKRRGRPLIERDHLPEDRAVQSAFVRDEVNRATLVLRLRDDAGPIDPGLVASLFSPSYQIRMIVLARTVGVAREALGAAYLQSLMQVALRPLTERRAAIHPLLDRWLASHGSPLRVADLTPENQQALLVHDWRDNLSKLRETAERLDAIVRAPEFSLNKARKTLGVARSTFYSWFGSTLRLSPPLVSDERAPAVLAAVAAQASDAKPAPSPDPHDDEDSIDDE